MDPASRRAQVPTSRAAPRRPLAALVGCVILGAASVGLRVFGGRASRAAGGHDQVLFVCEHGAAKSIIAATYFNELAARRGLSTRATARGAEAQAAPSAATVEGLRADGLTPALDRPQPLAVADLKASRQVVAFDCGAPAMKAVAEVGACWNDVPTVSDGYGRARDSIREHVRILVDDEARRGDPR